MRAKSAQPSAEDLATEHLLAAVESAISAIRERLANLADDDNQDARQPRTVFAYWVDNPHIIDPESNPNIEI